MQGKIEGFRFERSAFRDATFVSRFRCLFPLLAIDRWGRGETKRAQVNTGAYTLVFGNTSSRLYKGDIIEWRSALCGK